MAYAWKYCALFLFLLVVAGSLCDATDYNVLNFEMARKHEQWMAEYGRVYKNEAERALRFEIFKKNIKYIEDFNNAGAHSYTLGVNQFADLTNKEFSASYFGDETSKTELEEFHRSMKYETVEPLNVPSSKNWREEDAVTHVKNQGACGKQFSISSPGVCSD